MLFCSMEEIRSTMNDGCCKRRCFTASVWNGAPVGHLLRKIDQLVDLSELGRT